MIDKSEIIRVLTGFAYFKRSNGEKTVLVTEGQSMSNSMFREVESQNLSCFVKDGWEFYYSDSILTACTDLYLLDTKWDKCKTILKCIDQIAGEAFKDNPFRLVQVRTGRG